MSLNAFEGPWELGFVEKENPNPKFLEETFSIKPKNVERMELWCDCF